MALKDLFDAARVASTPPREATHRVLSRLRRADRLDDRPVAELLAGRGAPHPGAVPRVLARVRATRRARRRRWAAVASLALMAAMAGWFVRIADTSAPPPPRVLDQALVADVRDEVGLTEAVTVAYRGRGRAEGTHPAPYIRWERGRLDVDVDPEAGARLVVETDEAHVAVLGTVFGVERDPVGTTVDVTRGRVQVRCGRRSPRVLGPGARVTCWPQTLTGLLGRARTLEARGAAPAAVLATLDRALVTEGPPMVRGEVLAHRVRWFQAAERATEALDTARQYLAEGHQPRRDEMTQFVHPLNGGSR